MRLYNFCASMLFAIVLCMIVACIASAEEPPIKPKEISWPGGIWKKDGKDYPKDSFTYTPQIEYDNFLSKFNSWAKENPIKVTSLKSTECTFKTSLFNLDKLDNTCTKINHYWEKLDVISAYGGRGTIELTFSPYGQRHLHIDMYDMDLEQMSRGINLRTPVQISGTVKYLTGTIIGNKGNFVTTKVETRGSITISKLELSVDLSTKRGVATGYTSMGTRSFPITLP